MSRFFTNPKWVDAIGRRVTVIEACDGTTAYNHNLPDGTCKLWEYAAKSSGRQAVERCLSAVEKGQWFELTFVEAFPDKVPKTTTELVW